MKFGFNRFDMTSVTAFAESVAMGEELGYDYALIPSSPLLARDPYIMLAEAARRTSRIRLAPMIENPVTRHPAVIAGSIATLAEVSGDRADVALGVGDTAVRLLDLAPARVRALESAVDQITTLLRGERYAYGEKTPRLRHARPVPVWVAAGGPKNLKMAGRLADGVIVRVGTHPDNIAFALQQVSEGAREAGRSMADIQIAAVFHTVMSDDEAVVGHIGRSIAAGYFEYAPYLFERAGLDWNGPEVESLREQIWQDFHHTPDLIKAGSLLEFLPDQAVADFSLHGSAGDILSQITSLSSRHPEISVVVPHPMTPPPQSPEEHPHQDFMMQFARGVIQDTAMA